VAELLLNAGANMNIVNNQQTTGTRWCPALCGCLSGLACTALLVAVAAGQRQTVELMLQRRANPFFTTYHGRTALHLAVENDLAEVTPFAAHRLPVCISPRDPRPQVAEVLLTYAADLLERKDTAAEGTPVSATAGLIPCLLATRC
jgi:hypothetical protein